jgi:hypothetical protein
MAGTEDSGGRGVNNNFHFLFPLNGEWALGGDSQTLLLLKFRVPNLEGSPESGQALWHPVLRCGNSVENVHGAIQAKDILLSDEAAAELKSLPEIFWAIPRAIWHGAEW